MLSKTKRTTPRAKPDRISYDRDHAYAILDEALVCHVGFVAEDGPLVIPTTHWRIGDHLYFHGGRASRLAHVLASGQTVSVTATLVDGLVLSRSAFHHSMNYRSVVLVGQGVEITDEAAKAQAFLHLIDKLVPGRAAKVRPPAAKELAATMLMALPIGEGSAKMRSGPPMERESDLTWPVWAGVIPVTTGRGAPLPDQYVPADIVF